MVDLKLPKDEVSDASEYINKFVDCFKEELQSKAPSGLCLDEFRSGSYYDKTKIGSPDEFDIMFYPSNINLKAEFDDRLPGYCKIKIQGQPPPEYRDLVTKDGYLNPWKFKDKLFKLFSECIRSASFRPGRRTKRTERPPESPAFTVLFDTVPGKQPIDIDLVPSVQIQGWPKVARKIKPHWLKKEHAKHAMKMYHAVAKSCPYDVPNKELYWRISFSHAEKTLVKFANNGNGNSRRKDIFRIMKQLKHYVKEQNPDKIEKFCSYHLKMFMLNEFDSWRGEVSNQDDLLILVLETVYRLTRCLQRSTILNYFIRNDNILKFVPHGELDLVCKSFEKYNSSS
ncbi:hypothetical protein FSP39_016241 [Pinctada imbricata]|uniref:Cyclic GMP-AMP synthase n=1 Tax=Pinctada imbricata TaxID=66713 RepID=A0AA88YXF7_PINIB|nr:hypothetical protein FSP39_016241 [Pinctada imbricata]